MRKSKNIWIISKYASPIKYPRQFGIGSTLAKKGFDVTLITSVSNSVAKDDVPQFSGWMKIEYVDGIRVIWMNGPQVSFDGWIRVFSWLWFEFKILLSFWFISNKPRTVIASSLSLLSVWSGLIVAYYSRAKFVFEVRDIWPLSLIELGGISSNNYIIRFLSFTENIGYKHANAIVGTMPNLKDHVININKAYGAKVFCVPQGVALGIFEEEATKLSQDYIDKYIPTGKFIIAYTGTLNPNNPIEILFEVAKKFEYEQPQIHFIILGQGRNKESYIKDYGALRNISFPPVISKNQMAHFLSFVDVGYDSFSSTLGKFGLSRNKWIDYMYNRCIIVCSYDGYQSMLNESNSGFFVPYGDDQALAEMFLNIYEMPQVSRELMQERARSFIKENRTFDKLGEVYERIIEM